MLIVSVKKQVLNYEILVCSATQKVILHIDTTQDILNIYAQSTQCLLLMGINNLTEHDHHQSPQPLGF